MLPETIQLETLRQKIEDSEYEAGDRSDYLSYGKPNPAQAKQAQELIEKLKEDSKAARAELNQLLGSLRAQQPQAVEEWVNYHAGLLQKIIDEKTEAVITPRKTWRKKPCKTGIRFAQANWIM
ncbi:hypothetical protein [Candidatus Villigracilis affinis]|uniref:hypothetical protein n=1 Tax=Candidatus Villigracilis affinis TaxID=3140682 RepID=UPI002A19674E|nr:hypothetical protein [Anaerolineales bacterium]